MEGPIPTVPDPPWKNRLDGGQTCRRPRSLTAWIGWPRLNRVGSGGRQHGQRLVKPPAQASIGGGLVLPWKRVLRVPKVVNPCMSSCKSLSKKPKTAAPRLPLRFKNSNNNNDIKCGPKIY